MKAFARLCDTSTYDITLDILIYRTHVTFCLPIFAVPQTDFSVARRLLSVDVGYQAATLDGKGEVKVPDSPSVGWQFILPTDHRKDFYNMPLSFPSGKLNRLFILADSSLAYKHKVFPGPLTSDGFSQYAVPYLSPVSSTRPAVYTVYHGQATAGSGEPSPVELGEYTHTWVGTYVCNPLSTFVSQKVLQSTCVTKICPLKQQEVRLSWVVQLTVSHLIESFFDL